MTQLQDTPGVSIDAVSVRRALERAHRAARSRQRDDGSWTTPGDVGPISTAQVLIVLGYLHQLDASIEARCTDWLRAQQRADGSFVAYPYANVGDVGATATAWAALANASGAENRAAAGRAWAYIAGKGGIPSIAALLNQGDASPLFVAIAGKLPPDALPATPLVLGLIPGAESFLETRFHVGIVMMGYATGILVRRLRGDWGPDGNRKDWFTRLECDHAVGLVSSMQNGEGSWNAYAEPTAISLATLYAAGVTPDDERIVRGVAWLKRQRIEDRDGSWYPGFMMPLWATAFDVRALVCSGVGPDAAEVARAADWIVNAQCAQPQAKVNNRHPGVPLTGGWAFDLGNDKMPDCDDTGVVLGVLGLLRKRDASSAVPAVSPLRRRIDEAYERGAAWLLGMQNPDGGWASYVWGLPGKPPGPIMTKPVGIPLNDPIAAIEMLFNPPLGLGDPSTEDVTGRVLWGLGLNGWTLDSPQIAAAVHFLRVQQCESGAWWGRWLMNFLAGTSFALMGLAAVGVSMRERWVRRGVGWILGKQNADGSWGETPESYTDPSLAGIGPGVAPLTGLVTSALIVAGERNSEAVSRGVRFLLDAQAPDGSWANGNYLTPLILPNSFYAHLEDAQYYPLEALGRYLGASSP